jgi:hypothetical protein
MMTIAAPSATVAGDADRAAGGAITDDTQMALFTAEALLGNGDPVDELRNAYLRWQQTPGGALPSGSGLLAVLELHSPTAPGSTCLSALWATREGARGTTKDPVGR